MSKKKDPEPTPVASSGWKPVPKITASALAGAVTLILVAVLGQFDVEVTAEVASALTVIIMAVAGWDIPRQVCTPKHLFEWITTNAEQCHIKRRPHFLS